MLVTGWAHNLLSSCRQVVVHNVVDSMKRLVIVVNWHSIQGRSYRGPIQLWLYEERDSLTEISLIKATDGRVSHSLVSYFTPS